ncbi:hypothetical protein PI125_g11616 [Phytophthora idaei]|nr:hypothetical protein PI125_g11616 [Phytophthora idaei]
MTLKDTGFPAWGTTCGGVTYVQGKLGDTSTVWWTGYSRNRIQRDVTEATTVLVEGLPELDDTMKVARTLSTVQGGMLLVEVCKASRSDVVVRQGARLAVATVVPGSAFGAGGKAR